MTVPYVFTPNTTISSAQVNANFAALNMGITDGQAPPAGQVGEYIESAWGGGPTNDQTQMVVAQLSLSAGCWDVSAIGNINFQSVNASPTYQCDVRFGVGTAAQLPSLSGPLENVNWALWPKTAMRWFVTDPWVSVEGAASNLSFVPTRFNFATPTAVLLAGIYWYDGANRASLNGYMQARRAA